MRNVKRLLALLCLVALLVTSLCACAQKPADNGQNDNTAKTEQPAANNDSKAEDNKTDETPSGETVMVGSEGSITADEFGYEATPAKKYTIAVVVKSAAIPVWESHIVAAKKAGSELGVEILDYSPSKADNVEEQKRILEDLITTGVDAVILAPANTEAVKGPVQELIDAGIPVIYDNTMGPSDVDYLTYVGVDNAEVGRMIAEEMASKINYKGKVLVMEGVPGQATSDVRTQAAMEVFASYPDITVESGVTSWQTDEGRKLAEDYITKWGDELKAIVAVGGNQAEGAVEAVKAAGMQDKVLVSGFDVQEPQYLAVANGDEVFTVSQGVYQQAYLSVVAAIRALNGESVPRQINCPITIVNKDNLDSMDERPAALQNR